MDGEEVRWVVKDSAQDARGKTWLRLFTVVVARRNFWIEFTGWSDPSSFAESEPTFRRMAASLQFP